VNRGRNSREENTKRVKIDTMNKEKIVLRVGNKEEFSIQESTKGGQRLTQTNTETNSGREGERDRNMS